jgi:hypothetical protein
MDELIGKIGQASGAIVPGKPGEVLLPFKGGFESFLAYADEPIVKGARVTVVDVLPGRTVFVKSTARAIGSTPTGTPKPGSNLMNRPVGKE